MLAYTIVLFVYSRGTVAYTAAGREISIVFGALIGWRYLGEGLKTARVFGALLIFGGIATIAIWGETHLHPMHFGHARNVAQGVHQSLQLLRCAH